MSKRFFISDLHFDHLKMVEYRGFSSVEQMNEHIISRWCSVVTGSDKVFVLGDVALNTTPESLNAHLARLPGEKILIMGNHDTDPAKIAVYDRHFSQRVGCLEFKRVILTHIPVHESQFGRFTHNIHGHLHQHILPDPRYINVSCEQVNYIPVEFDAVVRREAE